MANSYSDASVMSTGKIATRHKKTQVVKDGSIVAGLLPPFNVFFSWIVLLVPLCGLGSLITSLLNFAGTVDRFVHNRIASVSHLRRSGDVHIEFV